MTTTSSSILVSGRDITTQYVHDISAAYAFRLFLADPDFAAIQDDDIWAKVRRDAHVAHAIEKRKRAVASLEWHVEPGGDGEDDKKAAKVIERVLQKIGRFTEGRRHLANAIFRGSAYAAILGRRMTLDPDNDGRDQEWWVPTNLKDVDKRRLRQVADRDKITGAVTIRWELWSVGRQKWEPLEHPEWLIRHVHDQTEDTLNYGRGLLEAIYWYHFFKSLVLREGLQGMEKWARGWVMGAIDNLRKAGTDKEGSDIRQNYIDQLEAQQTRHIFVHDKEDEITVLEGSGQGWQIVDRLLQYFDRELDRVILSATLPTGGGGEIGSFARAGVEQDESIALFRSDQQALNEDITRDLIGLVWKLNRPQLAALGLSRAEMPRFTTTIDSREPPQEIAGVVETALRSGISLRKDEVYKRIGFTPPTTEDEENENVIEPLPPQPVGALPFSLDAKARGLNQGVNFAKPIGPSRWHTFAPYLPKFDDDNGT